MKSVIIVLFVFLVIARSAAMQSDLDCNNVTWYTTRNGECKCGSELNGQVLCNECNRTVEITAGLCMTYDAVGRFDTDTLVVGDCLYGALSDTTQSKFTPLPTDPTLVNGTLCDPYNRRGLFCGECKEGFGPSVYSFDLHCANCSEISQAAAICLYILLELVPITVMFIVVLLCQPSLMTGPQLGYVMICQALVSSLQYSRYLYFSLAYSVPWPVTVLGKMGLVLAGIWELEFFRFVIPAFCVSEKMRGVHVLMLGFVRTLFPMVLVLVTYAAIELDPCHGLFARFVISHNLGNTVIHAFATFTMLSIFSTVSQAYAILQTTIVRDVSGNVRGSVLQFDPTVEMWSVDHVPYLVTSLCLVFFLAACPGILLCVYPTRLYRRLSQGLSTRKQLTLKIYAETVNGGFKDGLNGTRDCRMVPGAIILLAITFSISMSVTPHNGFDSFAPVVIGVILVLLAIAISYVRPCKTLLTNISLSIHMLLMGMLSVLCALWWQDFLLGSELLASWIVMLSLFPHVFMLSCVVCTACKRYGCCGYAAEYGRRFIRKICGVFRSSYGAIGVPLTAPAAAADDSDDDGGQGELF